MIRLQKAEPCLLGKHTAPGAPPSSIRSCASSCPHRQAGRAAPGAAWSPRNAAGPGDGARKPGSPARLQIPVHIARQPCKSPLYGIPVNPFLLYSIPANPYPHSTESLQTPRGARSHRNAAGLSDRAGKPGSPARLQIPVLTAWQPCKSPSLLNGILANPTTVGTSKQSHQHPKGAKADGSIAS